MSVNYNEIVDGVRDVLSDEFNITLDEFFEEVKLGTIGITGLVANEFEDAICNKFNIVNLGDVYDDEITIGELVNSIMEKCNVPDGESQEIYEEDAGLEDLEYTLLVVLVMAILIFVLFL